MKAPSEKPQGKDSRASARQLSAGEMLMIRFAEPIVCPGQRSAPELPLSTPAVIVGTTPDSIIVRMAPPFVPMDVAGRAASAVMVEGSKSLVAQVRAVPILVDDERLLELRLSSKWQSEDRRESLRVKCTTRARIAPLDGTSDMEFIAPAIDISHSGIAVSASDEIGANFTEGGMATCRLELQGATLELRCRVATVRPDRIGLAFECPDAHAQRIIGAYLFRLQVQERKGEAQD